MNTWQIMDGDALERLRELDAGTVQTCVTSPPYFGLRDYGTGSWEGGDEGKRCPECGGAGRAYFYHPDDAQDGYGHCAACEGTGLVICDHLGPPKASERSGLKNDGRPNPGRKDYELDVAVPYRDVCGKCGATRTDSQVGLEATPDEYVARLVEVFREVRRVLRDDGTLWLNLGDSYNAYNGNRGPSPGFSAAADEARNEPERGLTYSGCKPKDLLGIPWMVAFALRADGWVLRQEIVWKKPNPMPESVTDRCTKSHEQIFMFSKAKWTGTEEPLPMREIDAAWLAALVDGEGSICFQDRTSEGAGAATWSVRLSVVNTNRALLERITEICDLAGVGAPSPRTRTDGSVGRPVYAWQVTNAKAARVIAAIKPHLIAKATQAELALYVQALNRKHTGRGGHTVSKADQEAKARAAAACSALNRGLEVDLSWFRPVKPGRWIPMPYMYDADAIREQDGGQPSGNGFAGRQDHRISGGLAVGGTEEQWEPGGGRNKRSVWTVATQPFPGAHFAVFPPKLIEPCVKAGSAEDACGVCGAPWERVVEHVPAAVAEMRPKDARKFLGASPSSTLGTSNSHDGAVRNGTNRTMGFKPSCDHQDKTGTSTVLDPFSGAGTTGLVATRLGRSFIGIELNPAYAEMSRERIRDDQPLFNWQTEAAVGAAEGGGG